MLRPNVLVCLCACEQIKGTDDPNVCVLHSIEELPSMLGYISSFMLNYMMTSFTSKMMRTMLVKHKAHKGIG